MDTTTNTPAPKAKPGERMTFAEFDGVSLWCSYTLDDLQVILSSVWVNGEWVDALALFGNEQLENWATAVEVAVHEDADALAADVMEFMPAFEGSLARAAMRNQEWR